MSFVKSLLLISTFSILPTVLTQSVTRYHLRIFPTRLNSLSDTSTTASYSTLTLFEPESTNATLEADGSRFLGNSSTQIDSFFPITLGPDFEVALPSDPPAIWRTGRTRRNSFIQFTEISATTVSDAEKIAVSNKAAGYPGGYQVTNAGTYNGWHMCRTSPGSSEFALAFGVPDDTTGCSPVWLTAVAVIKSPIDKSMHSAQGTHNVSHTNSTRITSGNSTTTFHIPTITPSINAAPLRYTVAGLAMTVTIIASVVLLL